MPFAAKNIEYRDLNILTKIVSDYLSGDNALKSFYEHDASVEGISQAIKKRKRFATPRKTLVTHLEKQYEQIKSSEKVLKNIQALAQENCFTVTTAHQNNLFTGPLYFIYKILHAIRLAEDLKKAYPESTFVPVYWIGSEDADLAELNHIYIQGEKYEWLTNQTGAVGRMKIDKEVTALIDRIEGQLGVLPFGKEITSRIREFYQEGKSLEQATFQFVNHLFGDFGLIVLLPDDRELKKTMLSIFEDDLLHAKGAELVSGTGKKLEEKGYKVQAHPREINLFYLKDNIRERIEKVGEEYLVNNTSFSFSESEMLEELKQYPERFSPNVILRGLYQETVLPNIAFIGGPGEMSYWLQLKSLFDHYQVPYPVLVLRNSYLLINQLQQEKIEKLGFSETDIFQKEDVLLNQLVKKDSSNDLQVSTAFSSIEKQYDHFKEQAAAIDPTLTRHVEALKKQTINRLIELEKKMLRAEKRKFTDEKRQITNLKSELFPRNSLQERIESFLSFYSKWGGEFIKTLYEQSKALEATFVVINHQEKNK